MGLVCAVDYARLSITPRQYGVGGSLEDQPQSSRTKMLPSLQLLGPVHTKTIVQFRRRRKKNPLEHRLNNAELCAPLPRKYSCLILHELAEFTKIKHFMLKKKKKKILNTDMVACLVGYPIILVFVFAACAFITSEVTVFPRVGVRNQPIATPPNAFSYTMRWLVCRATSRANFHPCSCWQCGSGQLHCVLYIAFILKDCSKARGVAQLQLQRRKGCRRHFGILMIRQFY